MSLELFIQSITFVFFDPSRYAVVKHKHSARNRPVPNIDCTFTDNGHHRSHVKLPSAHHINVKCLIIMHLSMQFSPTYQVQALPIKGFDAECGSEGVAFQLIEL